MPDLQQEWEQLLGIFGIDASRAMPVFIALSNAYSRPERVYHTLEHIRAMLGWIKHLSPYAQDLPTLQLATWFHDSVYDPRAHDNEEQSALYAQKMLAEIAVPSPIVQTVARLILCTKTHKVEDAFIDGQILLDADLAMLGAPIAHYDAYARAIRQEYAWVPEETYKSARTQVLHTFLQRKRIYQTEPMYALLEKPARENLLREITSLA